MRAGFATGKSVGLVDARAAPASRYGGPRLIDRVLEILRICSRAAAAAHYYEQLKPLSDQALAARGLKRADLPRVAFEKLSEEP